MKSCPFNVVDINRIIFISNEKQPSLFKQLCIFFAQLFYYTFIQHFKYKDLPPHYQGIMFFGVSINNQRSLDPIANHLDQDEYLYLRNHMTDVHKRRAYWLALPYLPNLIRTYKEADSKTKPFIKKYFTRLWTTYGYYQLAKEYLEQYKVKVLVLSSDQGEFHRCLLMNARQTDTKTIYVQHASVAKGFPKLIASYSFLDGRESLEKYLYAGPPEGEVYLSGGVRFDPVFQKHEPKKREQTHLIGIAINMLDDFAQVKCLCHLLSQKGFELVLRPHPRYGALDTQWLQENGIGFSDPKEESSFDFISRIDLMVSNESSIHLDAALMRCPSIVFNFSKNPVLDYYSYIKSGLTRLAENEEQLVDMVSHPQSLTPSLQALQYYNASIGTPLQSTLAATLAHFVSLLARGKADDFDETYGFHQTDEPFIHAINP